MPRPRTLALLTAALLVGGCSSSTDPGSDEPDGISITLNGTVVARATDGSVEGGIHLHYGESSGLFVVEILSDRGLALDPGSGLTLEVVAGDPSIASFAPLTPGGFLGEFEILEEGETTLIFRLMREGSDTPEWTSPAIPLFVTAC